MGLALRPLGVGQAFLLFRVGQAFQPVIRLLTGNPAEVLLQPDQLRRVRKPRRRWRLQHDRLQHIDALAGEGSMHSLQRAQRPSEQTGRIDRAARLSFPHLRGIGQQGDFNRLGPAGQHGQQEQFLSGKTRKAVDPGAGGREVRRSRQHFAGELEVLPGVEFVVAEVGEIRRVDLGEVSELGGAGRRKGGIGAGEAQLLRRDGLLEQLAEGVTQAVEEAGHPLDALVEAQLRGELLQQAAQDHRPRLGGEGVALRSPGMLEDAVGQAPKAEHLGAGHGPDLAGQQRPLHLQAGLFRNEQNERRALERRGGELVLDGRDAPVSFPNAGAADDKPDGHDRVSSRTPLAGQAWGPALPLGAVFHPEVIVQRRADPLAVGHRQHRRRDDRAREGQPPEPPQRPDAEDHQHDRDDEKNPVAHDPERPGVAGVRLELQPAALAALVQGKPAAELLAASASRAALPQAAPEHGHQRGRGFAWNGRIGHFAAGTVSAAWQKARRAWGMMAARRHDVPATAGEGR